MGSELKYSRQRDAIYAALMSTKEHPSAQSIYESLRNEFPNLSLATVYRNLALFKREGAAKCVGTVDGVERFDGDMTPHSHFICTTCATVYDISNEITSAYLDSISHDMVSQADSLAVYGKCTNCSEA